MRTVLVSFLILGTNPTTTNVSAGHVAMDAYCFQSAAAGNQIGNPTTTSVGSKRGLDVNCIGGLDAGSSVVLPSCAAGQVLTSDGGILTCIDAGVALPSCGANQVLGNSGDAFVCVDAGVSLPTCGSNQALDSSGTAFVCTDAGMTLPNCTTFQTLTSDGGSLLCVDVTQSVGRALVVGEPVDGGLPSAV